jgi:chloramphenicol O-acetyltransferase type A
MPQIDLETWPRAELYRHFRSYAKPHFAVTSRVDVSALMRAKAARGISVYRACLYAVSRGLHAHPALLTRFRGDAVMQYETCSLSMTVATPEGGFNYAYVDCAPDWEDFDRDAADAIAEARARTCLSPDAGNDCVAYLTSLPWMDFTAFDNALVSKDDCIPRVAWGRITPEGNRHRMALSIEVHHALIDGAHLGAFFEAVQEAFDRF